MRTMCALVLVGALALTACSSLEGDGNVVTESRTVADFDTVDADNGVTVILTVDPTVNGDVVLEVTTDSNIQEILTTTVSGTELSVSTDRNGGVTPSGPFDVSGTTAIVRTVSADNGAEIRLLGSVGDVTLSANSGADVDAQAIEAVNVIVNADNGAKISVCATGAVTGNAKNGADVAVLCGGSFSGVETSDGGTVSSTP